MATQTESFSFAQIIPPSLADDPQVQAAITALDGEFQAVTAAVPEIIILPEIPNLTSDILDALAVQFHVDYYDQTAPVATKIQLIQNSIAWHRIKGTPAAVTQLVNAAFGYAQVQEWFQYSGSPYHFRVYTSDSNLDATHTANLTKAINSAKNCRSWLDGIVRIGAGTTNSIYMKPAIVRQRSQAVWVTPRTS